MRIRKRWPTPSLAPPLESLHHQQSPNDPPIEEPPPPHPPRSDLQLTFVKGTNGWIFRTDDDCMHSTSSSTQLGEGALLNNKKIGKLSTATAPADAKYSKDNRSGAKDGVGKSSSTSACQLGEKGCNAEVESAKTTKTNTTLEVDDNRGMIKMKREKVHTDSAMDEGSRCNRVNGRGWRCWKQAVLGHSLCEHHSSRGRLRNAAAVSSLPVLLDEEPLIMLKKRKKKVGMIKNRSISGLLAQTDPQPAPAMPMLNSIAIL